MYSFVDLFHPARIQRESSEIHVRMREFAWSKNEIRQRGLTASR
jgi:hypothetical protein